MSNNHMFVLVWLAVMYIVVLNKNAHRFEIIYGKSKIRLLPFWAVVIFFPLTLWAANRGYVGDTYSYINMFRNLPNTFSELLEYLPLVTKDKGFSFLSGVIKCIFGNNSISYFFLLAFFQSIVLISLYRKYSPNYLLSVFLFVVSTDYFSWMFNGIRQFTAVTIILIATKYMIEKKWIPTILIILLASTMHQSALLMLPIVFIVQGKAWNKKTIYFLILALLAVLFVDKFTTILDDMMQETQYANMVTDWTMWEDDGTNALRVLVYAIPTILSLVGLKYIRIENDPVIDFCTNMSIVSTGIYIISMFTSGIFIGRLPIYASLYNYILLPLEIERMFTKKSIHLVSVLMVIAYLIFYYYQIEITW